MTGCPNGCARPYQSDIGLVGRSGDKFTIVGTANGFKTDKPNEPASATFKIIATC